MLHHEAEFYERVGANQVQCHLCPHECRIGPGDTGRCGVRRNDAGTLRASAYGAITSLAVDPIEKKPLYHFL
ncbi:MAG TPA: AmmeMemoRadiSam system radical SAM enzyme, partial [Armatimonadota bacterium]|nr:AmmeMemoRadiSam system radical SAM enzyme [Armatimonadota bacterium]